MLQRIKARARPSTAPVHPIVGAALSRSVIGKDARVCPVVGRAFGGSEHPIGFGWRDISRKRLHNGVSKARPWGEGDWNAIRRLRFRIAINTAALVRRRGQASSQCRLGIARAATKSSSTDKMLRENLTWNRKADASQSGIARPRAFRFRCILRTFHAQIALARAGPVADCNHPFTKLAA